MAGCGGWGKEGSDASGSVVSLGVMERAVVSHVAANVLNAAELCT